MDFYPILTDTLVEGNASKASRPVHRVGDPQRPGRGRAPRPGGSDATGANVSERRRCGDDPGVRSGCSRTRGQRPDLQRFRSTRQRPSPADSLSAIRSPVAPQRGNPGRHERQHADRREDLDGAPGVRLDPDATAPGRGRSRGVHVRRLAPPTSRFHPRSLDAERRPDDFRALRHNLPLRRHGGGGAEAGGAIGHAQGHHRAHRWHRHQQRHDGPGGIGAGQFDRRAGVRRRHGAVA